MFFERMEIGERPVQFTRLTPHSPPHIRHILSPHILARAQRETRMSVIGIYRQS